MENEVEKSPQYKSGLGNKLAISNLDYHKFNKEIKKIIKQTKQYKDVIENIQLYLDKQRIKLSVSEKITLNRKMLYCCNKLLKQQVIDTGEYDKNVINNYMEKSQRYIFESYRFINLYLRKIIPNRLKTAIFSDASFLTSEDEYKQQKLQKKKILTIDELNTQYDFHPELVRQKKNQYLEHQDYEKCDAYRTQQIIDNEFSITQSNPTVEIGYELTQYFVNLVKHLMNLSYVYKSHRLKPPKLKIAYFYLIESERIIDKITFSADPDILQLAAKVKIALCSFYFEAGRSEMALQKIEEALLLSQFDIHLNFATKRKSASNAKQEKKQLFSIKLLLFILNNMAVICQQLKQYQRMYECMMLADYVNQKTLQKVKKLDDLAKFTQKQVSIVKDYKVYLEEEAEIIWIAEQQLGVPLTQIIREENIKLKQQNALRNQNFVKSQITLFQKFQNKSLLKTQFFSYNNPKDQQQKKQEKKQKLKERSPNNKKFKEDLDDENLYFIQQKGLDNKLKQDNSNTNSDQQKIQQQQKQLFDKIQQNFTHFKNINDQEKQTQQQQDEFAESNQSKAKKPNPNNNQSESNLDKKTQLSLTFDSQSDDGFFNESFFAPSSDREEEWKSAIQNSVKQSFIWKHQQESHMNIEQNKSNNTTKLVLGDQSHYKSHQQLNQNKYSQMLSKHDGSISSKSLQRHQQQSQSDHFNPHRKQKKKVTIDYPNVRYKQKIKISNYFKPGYHSDKPKVLTTNEYFQKRTNQENQKKVQKELLNRKNNPAIKNEVKFKQIKKNLENKDNWQYSGLDELIYNYVDTRIKDENKFISMNMVKQNQGQFEQKEEFDKNEFPYCRKMLHQKMLEGLKISTPQINFSDKPNSITMKGLVAKDIYFYDSKHFFQADMALVNHQKNLKKIDRIYDKQLDIDLGQEELELMKLKQLANKKKNLQEIIFNNKDHKIFEQAKFLKELYKKHEENMQQKLKEKRKKKEKELRDQENNLILQKEEQLQQKEMQQASSKSNKPKDEHRKSIITDQFSVATPRRDDEFFNFHQVKDQKIVKFEPNNFSDSIKESVDSQQKKEIQNLKHQKNQKSAFETMQKSKSKQPKDWITEDKHHHSPLKKSRNLSEGKPLLLNDIMAQNKLDKSNQYLHHSIDHKSQQQIKQIQKKTENVNKIISTQVDIEKWNNVELLKLSRIKLGKEKPQKEDMYDFNKGFASRFKDLRMSLQGIAQKTQFADSKRFFTFADMVQAKIQSQRKRNLIMGQNTKKTHKDAQL